MDTLETIARFADWLAFPLVYFILLLLFLFFVVRPFFSYLFDWNRIHVLGVLRKRERELQEAKETDFSLGLKQPEEVGVVPPPLSQTKDRRYVMSKLAAGDPEKAGNLVKRWLRKDLD